MVVTMIMVVMFLLAAAVMVIAIDKSSVLLKYRGEKSNKPKPKKISIAFLLVVALLLVPLGMAVFYLFINAVSLIGN